jgi:hypothetical protein
LWTSDSEGCFAGRAGGCDISGLGKVGRVVVIRWRGDTELGRNNMGMPAGVSLSHQLQPLELLLGELDRVDHARGMHGEGLFPPRLLSASGCHATTLCSLSRGTPHHQRLHDSDPAIPRAVSCNRLVVHRPLRVVKITRLDDRACLSVRSGAKTPSSISSHIPPSPHSIDTGPRAACPLSDAIARHHGPLQLLHL